MAINQPTLQQSGQLQGTTIRKGGQIFQEAITPAGAAALGATADQAKMAGVPAQKKPVLERAVARPVQQPTIAPRELGAGKAAEEAAQQAQAQQLGQFGGFNERVQKLVQSKFGAVTGVAATARIAEQDVLNSAFDENIQVAMPDGSVATVQDLLTQFASDPTNETPLVRLSEVLKQKGTFVAPKQIKQWIGTGERAIGEQAARTIADQIIMADFGAEDFTELGFENMDQMAAALDMDPGQFQTLTFGEFQDAVQAKQETMFTEVESLRAEMQNAPPGSVYAQQIQQRIADLTGAGVAVTEQRMAELVEDLNVADQITIGDRTLTIKEMLKDDNITQMVIDWVNAPEDMKEQIIPAKYGEFKDWINNQRELLEGLAQELQTTTTQFGVTQESLAGLRQQIATNPVLEQAMKDAGLDLAGFRTTADFAKLEAEAQKNPIFSLFFGELEGVDQNTRNAMITALDDESYERLKGKPIDQIISAWGVGQQVLNDPDLADFSGVKGGRFITDPDELGKIQAAQILLDEISQASTMSIEELKRVGGGNLVEAIKNKEIPTKYLKYLDKGPQLADDRILAMIKAGDINDSNIEDVLSTFPERMSAFKNDSREMTKLEEVSTDDDQFLDYLFDKDVDLDELNSNLTKSHTLSGMGAPGAAENIEQFWNLDVNRDGTIDNTDFQSIRDDNLADLDTKDYILGEERPDLSDLDFRQDPKMHAAMLRGTSAPPVFDEVISLLDGGITEEEARTVAERYDIDKIDKKWRKANFPKGYRSEDEYQATLKSEQPTEAAAFEGIGDVEIGLGRLKKPDDYTSSLSGLSISKEEYEKLPLKDQGMFTKNVVLPTTGIQEFGAQPEVELAPNQDNFWPT